MFKTISFLVLASLLAACGTTISQTQASPIPPAPSLTVQTPTCNPGSIVAINPLESGKTMPVSKWIQWRSGEYIIYPVGINNQYLVAEYSWQEPNTIKSKIDVTTNSKKTSNPKDYTVPVGTVLTLAVDASIGEMRFTIVTFVAAHCDTNSWSYSEEYEGKSHIFFPLPTPTPPGFQG